MRFDSQSFFDIDEDGFAEQISWVGPNDGLLAHDIDGNERIDDASELFGSIDEDGFTQLARLDANDDDVIDRSDPEFAALSIWRDVDGDGISGPGELHGLSDFSITALLLDATTVNEINAGNPVSHIGRFVVDKGGVSESRAMHDVWFRYDNMNSRHVEEINLDPRVSSLPNLRGYGIIPDLDIEMSLDHDGAGSLLAQVALLGDMEFEAYFGRDEDIKAALREVFLVWADVNDLAPESRGPFVDARQLAFLEKLVDEAYFQRGIHPDPFSGAAAYLNRLLEYVFDHYSARFMSQVIGEEIYRFENGYTLDPGTKPGLKSAYVLREDEFEGIVGLKPSGLTALERLAEASEDPDYVWDIALRMIEFSVGVENLPPEDLTLLSEALSASGASSLATHTMTIRTVGESLNVSIQERSLGERMNDADNDGFLAGSPEKDLLLGDNDDEVLEGADGDDEIRGRGGNDRLAGQDGSDYLLGGQGSDVYVFELGDGIDVIRESSDRKARDVIRFGAGIAFDALILERRGNTDLLISIRDNPLDAVLIENQFNKNSGVEVLRFADGSEEDLVEGRDYSLNGTGGDDQMLGVGNGGGVNDSIRGLGGNDTILGKFGDDELDGGEGDDRIVGGPGADVLVGGPGNDILHGGQGNDDLQGGAGDDVLDGGPGDDLFRYQGGDDRLSDSRGQFDRLVIDHAPSTDATYHRVGNDLRIALRDGGSIRFVKHFSGARIETISYSDSDVETASVEFTNQGGEGDDRLFGSAGKDTLIGDAGNDFLKGGDSGDSLDGGHGDDELDAGDGDDVLNPGHGDDVAKGGAGDDHFLYSSGHDRYADRSGERDVVTLSHHYRSEQVELLRRVETPRDLKLEINEANSITLQGHFTTRGAFEEVNFEGTEDKIDLKSLRPTTMGSPDDDVLSGVKQSADGRDMLFGLAGNDRIAAGAGDDWLAGGPGSDRLEGGAGADVYFYAIGDGDDIIVDTGGNDVIRFDEGIVSEDLVFTEDERDLVIGLPAHGNSRIVLMGHLGKATRRIESLEFADGSIQNLVNPN